MIAVTVYVICAATAFACAILLARTYAKTHVNLIFWSAVCFAGLTLANVLLVIDLVMVPGRDLSIYRDLVTLGSLSVLIYSLVWEMTP